MLLFRNLCFNCSNRLSPIRQSTKSSSKVIGQFKLFRTVLALGHIFEDLLFYSNFISLKFREKKENHLKMQRVAILKKISSLQASNYRVHHNTIQCRSLATVKDVFPNKTDFPSRHIGPRKTEVVAMLDLLGFKVMPKFTSENDFSSQKCNILVY